MRLESTLKDVVVNAMEETMAERVRELVATETRRVLREHEDKLTTLVRAAVDAAIEELFQ